MESAAYQVLFDANPLPMFVTDRETRRIVLVNRAACTHYGWSAEEFLGKSLRDIRPPELIPQFEAAYADTSKEGAPRYSRQARHVRKDGTVIEVTLEITTITLDGRASSLAVVTDVTGIAQAERRFRLLVEHSADGIALTNADHVVEYVSPGGQRILGYAPAEVLGKAATERTHPGSTTWALPDPGSTITQTARMLHRSGTYRWIEATTTNLTHEPAVRAFVSNYRDITERIESQQRLEFLLSATSAITYTARPSGDYGATFISANVKDVLGHSATDFTRDPRFWMDNIHPDDRALVLAELLDQRHALALVYRFRHHDGTYRWMRDVARQVGDEIVGYWVDVTEEVEAEASLRRSEESFRTLIERAPVPTFIHREGKFTYVNPAAVAILGYRSSADLVGRAVLDSVHPDDHDGLKRRMADVVANGMVGSGVVRMLRADGSAVVFEAEPIVLEFDGARSIVVMGHDVTARHELFARMALADRMLSVGTLAAGVAHEINNPLAYVAANLETVARELPHVHVARGGRLDERALAALVTDAREGVARISTIVRDLRALSRPDEDTRGPVDVAVVLGSSIKMAHHEIRHRARVVTSYADDLPLVEADATRLGQVFLNLLLNAAQAIADGRVDDNEICVRAAVEPDGKRLRIDISDTGIGIPPRVMRRIFDPFFTTKAPGVGTGLGLSISHQIVRALDGEISVDSEPGRGSTFSVMLPIAATQQVAAGAVGATRAHVIGRVLLIDDEVAIGRALAQLLAPDTEVVAVTRADEALARLAGGERFDAILCDVMMPDLSGIDLYARLAHVAPGYEGKVIFMTGGAFTPQARDFLAKIARPHLEKPFSEAELRTAIEAVMA